MKKTFLFIIVLLFNFINSQANARKSGGAGIILHHLGSQIPRETPIWTSLARAAISLEVGSNLGKNFELLGETTLTGLSSDIVLSPSVGLGIHLGETFRIVFAAGAHAQFGNSFGSVLFWNPQINYRIQEKWELRLGCRLEHLGSTTRANQSPYIFVMRVF